MLRLAPSLGTLLLVAACAAQDAPASRPGPAAPSPSAAATPSGQHWLVGRWRGEVTGTTASGRRVMTVTNVTADGTVTGQWAGQPTPMTLNGDALRVVSTGGASYELRRSGPDTLTGTQQSGRSNTRPLTMTRE